MTLVSKNVWKMTGLLLVVSLISLAVISGTFAKYTSTFAGADTALVAKWDITGTGDALELSDDGTANLNLFDHLYDTNIATDPAKLIAPGVKGSFVLKFTNNSDVAAKVTFDSLAVTGAAAAAPIKYSLTGSEDEDLTLSADQLKTALNDSDAFKDPLPIGGETPDVTVYWGWKFEDGRDAADTGLGIASVTDDRSEYILTINAKAVQVAPTE